MAERVLAGVTSETFNYLQLGAGAIIRDFDYESITDVADFKAAFLDALPTKNNLGGTRGGISINITPTTRKIDIDGTNLVSFIGDETVESWECSMGASLVQFSPQTFKEAFPSAEFTSVDTDEKITSMRVRQQFSDSDYAKNHTWISTTKYGYLMVSMFNTISMLSGEITTTANGEAVIPVSIKPKNKDFLDIDNLPVEVWFVDMQGGIIQTPKIALP